MDKKPTPDEIIDALGGTSKVAELSDVTDSAVSQWRINGIPKHQLKFLRLARPEIFTALGIGDVTPQRRSTDKSPAPIRAGRSLPTAETMLSCGAPAPPA
jgi:hypothetical protein